NLGEAGTPPAGTPPPHPARIPPKVRSFSGGPEMSRRIAGSLVAVCIGMMLTSAGIGGQARPPYSPARTPDGQPDLQGYWTNATYTPLERPAEFAGREFMTEAEAVAY